ncbi:protease HtpX [Mesosutterella sp. OilRF-GAM-744-9]|uniref:Protease HtpX homolog n=2 Tax=Mesosutterella TaxID=2494213 RepID=A0ABS9MSL8_9BURK|nr:MULTISPECIES: protease HtpX [unclassified Mesosutterella]MCG5031618.1 protease HtpX [Mesosutterella sp. oilRF-744-WT-GAM-9]MCI6529482.1 protease HtpX [Mesosutterella sp.]MDL2059132.1 protease HtpX [Mesosutterella sp. AGMB02718]
MLKRIGLFILTNLAIVVMLNLVLTVIGVLFGINWGDMAGQSINLSTLSVFALVVGFAGSIMSLLTSKMIVKATMGLQMIDTEHPATNLEAWLVSTVRGLAEKANVPMPEVGIYEGAPNAFATGPTKGDSLVAVSTGLLQLMNKKEVEAVLGHEMSHVANGDMVTMTLVQGVMNTFVIFLSRLVGWVVDRQVLRNESDAPGAGYYITSMILNIVLGLLAGMVVAAFSRWREYHADAGSAMLLGSPDAMIAALQRLGSITSEELPGAARGFGITGGVGSLFASHPSIEDRIAALRNLQA